MSDIKKLSVKEFREQGYLQELNRCFLHPLGLAMEVTLHEDGSESFGEVWDYRDEPDGMTFGHGMIDKDKAKRIEEERESKAFVRLARFNFVIQPAI